MKLITVNRLHKSLGTRVCACISPNSDLEFPYYTQVLTSVSVNGISDFRNYKCCKINTWSYVFTPTLGNRRD